MRPTATCPSLINVTLTTTIIQPKSHIQITKPPLFFTPNFSCPTKPTLRCQQCRNQAPKRQVTNFVIHIHCAGFALYHWLSGKNNPIFEVDCEENEILEVYHEPSAAQHVDVPTFQSNLPPALSILTTLLTHCLILFVPIALDSGAKSSFSLIYLKGWLWSSTEGRASAGRIASMT